MATSAMRQGDEDMSEYLYLPDYDGEYSIVHVSEYDESEHGKSKDAELVLSLEGNRGHYLSADFVINAARLLDDKELSTQDREQLAEHVENASTYNQHQGLFSGVEACEPMCGACEYVVEDAYAVEAMLSEHGFVVEWNDGVAVYRVSEDS